jgi:hypothetical protein
MMSSQAFSTRDMAPHLSHRVGLRPWTRPALTAEETWTRARARAQLRLRLSAWLAGGLCPIVGVGAVSLFLSGHIDSDLRDLGLLVSVQLAVLASVLAFLLRARIREDRDAERVLSPDR